MTVFARLEVKVGLVSEANQTRWKEIAKRKKLQQGAFWAAVIDKFGQVGTRPERYSEKRWGIRIVNPPPITHVHLLHMYRSLPMDQDDNLPRAFKGMKDAIAFSLGVDDGDRERVSWNYDQMKGKELVVVTISVP